jgi:dehydrogenase/reductase SDR family protein 4
MASVRCRRLEGKSAIVTASTAGIGLEIARRLALEGAQVVVSSRRAANVEETVKSLQEEGMQVHGLACHVGNNEHLQNLVEFTVKKYGKIDILVSNAAVNPAAGPILEMEETAISKILDINVKSAIMLAKFAVPYMKSGSSMVFVSSYTAFNPSPPIAMYAVSKTALLGLTKALAEELGPQNGIRVNCVAPGW